jgi:hypothetical protein
MIQLFLWKFKRVFIENEREKREGKKNIHCCPTKNPLLARTTSRTTRCSQSHGRSRTLAIALSLTCHLNDTEAMTH